MKTRTSRTRRNKPCRTTSPILLSALTGFVSGLLLSMPVGPVNLTIINGGRRNRGFKYAMLIGLGAATMDVIYCTDCLHQLFVVLLASALVKTSMEVFTFGFMLVSGRKNFFRRRP